MKKAPLMTAEHDCLGSFDFVRSKAGSANIDSLGSTVNVAFHSFDVGLPHSVGSSMRMADIITKMSAFSTNTAFCHEITPPCIF